jgi:hypothetical protein
LRGAGPPVLEQVYVAGWCLGYSQALPVLPDRSLYASAPRPSCVGCIRAGQFDKKWCISPDNQPIRRTENALQTVDTSTPARHGSIPINIATKIVTGRVCKGAWLKKAGWTTGISTSGVRSPSAGNHMHMRQRQRRRFRTPLVNRAVASTMTGPKTSTAIGCFVRTPKGVQSG